MLTELTKSSKLKNLLLLCLVVLFGQFTTQAGDLNITYYVCDSGDVLYKIDRSTGTITQVGPLNNGASWVEAIEYDAYQDKLYGANASTFGEINLTTGEWTTIADIDGGVALQGSVGNVFATDVDGLGFDTWTGDIWASTRRSGDYDVLFKIDPATGQVKRNAFGTNVDYVVIDGAGVYLDIDDIAVNPLNGKIYATSTVNAGEGKLIEINKFSGAVDSSFDLSEDDVEGLDVSSDGQIYGSTGLTNLLWEVALDGTMSNPVDLTDGGNCGDVEALGATTAPANDLSGKVWDDANNDQIINGAEAGIAGVVVNLYYDVNGDGLVDNGDVLLQSETTDASGDYDFQFATNANLITAVDGSTIPAAYGFTTDNVETAAFVDFANAEADPNNDFGIRQDTDCDGDGIPDFVEGTNDTDNDGINDNCDLDSDNDGILDSVEGLVDTDKDGVYDRLDKDSDNDGIPDAIEANNGASNILYDATLGTLVGADDDDDGLIDLIDSDPATPYATSTSLVPNSNNDGDSNPNYIDLDSDNDGILDVTEAGGVDSDGDGVVDGFSDTGDGYDDAINTTPLLNPNTDRTDEVANGTAVLPDYLDIDSDNDGIDDTREGWSSVDYDPPAIIQDVDNDGIIDAWDISLGGTPIGPVDTDGDFAPDYKDLDSDNDTVLDEIEGHDADMNGVADILPSGADVDNDGLDDNFDPFTGHILPSTPSSSAPVQDTDGTEDLDWRDIDDEGDSIPTALENTDENMNSIPDYLEFGDSDKDGVPNNVDVDDDNDGILDVDEQDCTATCVDIDSDKDGLPDHIDLDADNDGIPDIIEAGGVDTNDDGQVDYPTIGNPATMADADGDGLADQYDNTPIPNPDTDNDGINDFQDLDSDNDGIADLVEVGGVDTDADGKVDEMTDPLTGDPNKNGWADVIEATVLVSEDLNDPTVNFDGDTVPNHLDIDSDNDGIVDVRESGGEDSNGDGLVDDGAGTFEDLNGDGWEDNHEVMPTFADGGDLNPIPDFTTGQDEPDFDGDGQPNWLDIDADDDGIVDNTEAQTTTGYIAPVADTDGDGLTDEYEPAMVGTFGGKGIIPVNIDGIDNDDYLDLDSDNDGELDTLEGHDSDNDGTADSASPARDGVANLGDADFDGLDDGYDNDRLSTEPTNGGQNGTTHPDNTATTEADWREVNQNISGRTWEDDNENGINEPGEVVIANVTVTLFDSNDNQIAVATTDANGEYIFTDLPADTYYVVFTKPAAYGSGSPIAQGTVQTDSDADPSTGETTDYVLATNGAEIFIDAGFFGAPLPVKLISFTGKQLNCDIQLNWVTLEEENNDYFLVQRSLDGIHFKDLETVRGNGTTDLQQQYQYVDNSASAENYYRLKQVDYDGKFEYSKIINVNSDCFKGNYNIGLLDIYPNPIKLGGTLSMKIEMNQEETSLVSITDMYGKVLRVMEIDFDAGMNSLRMDTSDLLPGTYFLKAARKTKKFIVVRD